MAGGKNYVGQSGQGAERFPASRPPCRRATCRSRFVFTARKLPPSPARPNRRASTRCAPSKCRPKCAMNLSSTKTRRGRRIRRRSGKARPTRLLRASRENGSVDHGVSRMRGGHRRLLHDAGADSSSDGDARQHGFVDGRRRDGVGFHAGHFQRARRPGGRAATGSQQGARASPTSWAAASARKFGAGVEGVLAAKLSREAKAPVRLMLTRFDQALAVGNRPSSFQKIKIGALADGTLARV